MFRFSSCFLHWAPRTSATRPFFQAGEWNSLWEESGWFKKKDFLKWHWSFPQKSDTARLPCRKVPGWQAPTVGFRAPLLSMSRHTGITRLLREVSKRRTETKRNKGAGVQPEGNRPSKMDNKITSTSSEMWKNTLYPDTRKGCYRRGMGHLRTRKSFRELKTWKQKWETQ